MLIDVNAMIILKEYYFRDILMPSYDILDCEEHCFVQPTLSVCVPVV